jgi:hypothetical protein
MQKNEDSNSNNTHFRSLNNFFNDRGRTMTMRLDANIENSPKGRTLLKSEQIPQQVESRGPSAVVAISGRG